MQTHTERRNDLWSALLISFALHAGVFALWPHLQLRLETPVIVEGELVVPKLETPAPEIAPPPPAEPPPTEPEPIRPEPAPPEPRPSPKPDTGVALPILSAPPEAAGQDTADYVVADLPPLASTDDIPYGSKPGDTALENYEPGTASAGQYPGDGRGSEDPVDRDLLASFGESLRARASHFGGYPAAAQRRGHQGLVKILVRYDRNGEAYQIDLKAASGHKLLDQKALTMVTEACKDFPLPPELVKKAFSVVVPIEFKLH